MWLQVRLLFVACLGNLISSFKVTDESDEEKSA
jgi:hypothetical protein